MASIQSQFEEFHTNIKLDDDDHGAKLREKRETLVSNLRANLEEGVPSFTYFNQGSYAMNTGKKPKDGNYDIDVGLKFDCKRDKYKDPVELKKKIRDALTRPNRTVDIRRPCVTVTYLKDGKAEYHVDLAIYAKRDDDTLDLAMGKENSADDKRFWQVSDPQGLTSEINNRFTEQDGAQFRRCIRYLKHWRDQKFSNGGAPLSIALTTAAYHWFQPHKDLSGKYVDLIALKNLTNTILAKFGVTWFESSIADRLRVELPVTPKNDLMEKLTNAQMATFKERLIVLRDELVAAEKEALPEEACKRLQKLFGDDFPIPAKSETAKSVNAPYVSTGTSA
jgi:hypothetical protein